MFEFVIMLFLLLGAVLFPLVVSYFALGFGQVLIAKLRGKPIRTSRLGGQEITLETPQEKATREQREERKRYLNSLVDRAETPEGKEAREAREAKRRHLDSLVDRD